MNRMLDRITDTILTLVSLGGPVVMILLLMSMVALTVVLAKAWEMRGITEASFRAVEETVSGWVRGHAAEATRQLRTLTGPLAELTALAADGMIRQQNADSLRNLLEAFGRARSGELRRYLRILEATGQIAPLLGLFGTILGMIDVFQVLQGAGSHVDPGQLAGGIWVALLTTAVGIGVAIPSILALYWFEGRIGRLEHVMEEQVARVLANPPGTPSASGGRAETDPRAAKTGGLGYAH